MAHTIEFKQALAVLHVRYSGVLTDKALLEGFQDDLRAMRKHRARSVIVDLTEVPKFSLNSQTNIVLAESGRIPRGVRLIFVAPCDVQFGMARMFELSADEELSESVTVVRSIEEAYAVLEAADGSSNAHGLAAAG